LHQVAAPMTRADLSHVCLAVPDPEAVAAFYVESLGLCREVGDDGALRLGWGRGFHALELRQGDGLDHFGFSLPSEAALADLEARISSNGVAVERRPATGRHPEALVVRDPDGTAIELHGPVDRSGEHSADPGRRPVRIHHVTLGSADVLRQVTFYRDVLGFRVSDQMEEVFFWLRCNHEHHTLAIVDAERPALDHYCYEVDSWDSFKVWCDELATRDVPITWGPGRHGPGNNLFLFLDDPAGNRIELSAEMERFWDEAVEYRGRTWSITDRSLNLWGPMPSWRSRVA
jgi:catechol-2,3-dioxygenase